MKINVYVIVFCVILALIALFALSTAVFNRNVSESNVSLSDLTYNVPAPNIQGIAGWINSPPLNLTKLHGKVVLVDFWTYSCINCIREIPHLNAWENEYGDNGLVIIGVSTPEFQFEHNYSNVENAVQRFGIKYPVALDNNYSTWDAYGNEYWPAEYLIDANGDIRYVSYGEGNYNQTEQAIRELLKNAGYSVPSYTTNVPLGVNFSGIGTPEIYFGYNEVDGHGSHFTSSDVLIPNATVNYTAKNVTLRNTVYLSGKWMDKPEYIEAVNDSKIFLIYKAKNVNIVAEGNSTSEIGLFLNGTALNSSYIGSSDNIYNGNATAMINASRLYNIVSGPSYNGWHELEISATPGFKIYTFTFG
jgi:thiol-disulfide isomerase/thioredoxin